MHPVRDERGETLIELIIAVAIMGIAFVGILGAMSSGVVASSTHRSQADARAVLIAAVEKLKSSDTVYVDCATPTTGSYVSAAQSVAVPAEPATWTPSAIQITSITYWDGATNTFGSACQDVTAPLNRLQLIRMAVTSPENNTTESASFVKRG
jgi:prepilin-type N-terminal cleavage/methylation domain-containing protein